MIKFVILDDSLAIQKEIINLIEKIMFKTNYDYFIEDYNCYNSKLKSTIQDNSIRKIYILDIDLGKSKSGLEVAQEIRKVDWDSEIIFVTSHDKMFETVHRTVLKVFDFIEKFHHLNERLAKDIKLILNQKSDFGKFNFISDKIKMQVYLKDIMYIYRDTSERKLVIKLTNRKYLVNMTIAEILKQLDSRFRQIHRACIVNTDRVSGYCWHKSYFILDNNEQVNLCSKSFKENVDV